MESALKELLSRVKVLEGQISACLGNQPLLYQVFDKCNTLGEDQKEMKKEIDLRLAELVLAIGMGSPGHANPSPADISGRNIHQRNTVPLAEGEAGGSQIWQREVEEFELPSADVDPLILPEEESILEVEEMKYGTVVVMTGGGNGNEQGPEKEPLISINQMQNQSISEPRVSFGLAQHYVDERSIPIGEHEPSSFSKTSQSKNQKTKSSTYFSTHSCPICSREFGRMWLMQRHFRQRHPQWMNINADDFYSIEGRNKTSNKTFTTGKLMNPMRTGEDMPGHVSTLSPPGKQDAKVKNAFVTISNVKGTTSAKIFQKKSRNKKRLCSICGKWQNADGIRVCKKKNDPLKRANLTCQGCKRVFTRQVSVVRHQKNGHCPMSRAAQLNEEYDGQLPPDSDSS